jgi:hypothetical protein
MAAVIYLVNSRRKDEPEAKEEPQRSGDSAN